MIPGGKPSLAPEVHRMNRECWRESWRPQGPGWRVAFARGCEGNGGRGWQPSPTQPGPGEERSGEAQPGEACSPRHLLSSDLNCFLFQSRACQSGTRGENDRSDVSPESRHALSIKVPLETVVSQNSILREAMLGCFFLFQGCAL